MTKDKLIGSATSIEQAELIINRYFYSRRYKVDPETLEVSNEKLKQVDRNWTPKVKVVLKKGRYHIHLIN